MKKTEVNEVTPELEVTSSANEIVGEGNAGDTILPSEESNLNKNSSAVQVNNVKKAEKTKKKNWFIRLWNYYTTYEKIWLFSLITLGIVFALLMPETDENGEALKVATWLQVVQIIAIIGGCSCELLLSKQSRWAFIVSIILYDSTQTIVYFASGYYISALFEILFWIPINFTAFFIWNKSADKDNKNITVVKRINYKRDIAIFLGLLAISVVTGIIFTTISSVAEGMSQYWYLDALANACSVCNGLFLILRYEEQWIPWFGVALVEAVMWILSGSYIMLILSLGYLMNSTYGLIKWNKYTKKNPDADNTRRVDLYKQAKENKK